MLVSGLSDAVSVSAGDGFACAARTSGEVMCWGNNSDDALGNGLMTGSTMPVSVANLDPSSSAATALNAYFACAVTPSNSLECWGDDSSGQLGDGMKTAPRPTPAPVVGLPAGAVSVSAGGVGNSAFACTRSISPAPLYCWGVNGSGQLGNGTNTPSSSPVKVVGFTNTIAAISAGTSFACALTSIHGVACWGDDSAGQLGNGMTMGGSGVTRPVNVVGLGQATAVSSGRLASRAPSSNGAPSGWGAKLRTATSAMAR